MIFSASFVPWERTREGRKNTKTIIGAGLVGVYDMSLCFVPCT